MTDNISLIPFDQALSERYLSYALSTIMSRSLPDVRDGLKPVHRRVIYAMQQLRLNPTTPFKKSARVVGDVMGKFHPHGDAAIYDALVRLAQDFSVRYPLIDGQGNFGNIDGDNAAAMRYTEARLTKVATLLMEGIDEDAIDFRSTYDGESEEPLVFPSAFPNLLANGATGIAVGMATSIPPHNLGELCHALIYLIDHPQASLKDLITFIPGPDFPTGGVLVESSESIFKSYETGRGSFRLRAKWETESTKGGGVRIVVTQIPYQISKSKLIEKMADLLNDKKLPFLGDIMDESTDDVRLVLEPKSKAIDPIILMESLFRHTDLEIKFSLNMTVLDKGTIPRVMSLKEVLQAFLNHRQDVLGRRSTFRLKQIENRLEILKGYLIAYLNLDEVIHIIREEDSPKSILMERFHLTDAQAEAILNMRLRSLRKLQEIEIRQEYEELEKEQANLVDLLATPKLQWKRIKSDLKKVDKEFGAISPLGGRRTVLSDPPPLIDISTEAMIEREDVTIVCSEKGWIRTIKGHQVTADDLKYKEGDEKGYILTAQTTDKLIIFASNGRFYTFGVDKLPGGRGQGEPLRLMIDLDPADDILFMGILPPKGENFYLVASTDSRGFLVNTQDVLAQTRAGKQVLTLGEGERALACLEATEDLVATIGENRKLLIFKRSELPIMTRGRGVILQKLRQGKLSDIQLLSPEQGLRWIRSSKTFQEKELWTWSSRRGTLGRLAPIGFPRTNKFKG